MVAHFTPYPAMKDSGVGWLGHVPVHWDVRRTKSLLSRNDSGVWGSDFDDDGVIVLRSTEQRVNGEWNILTPARRRLSAAEYASCRLEEGDLLVTKSSGSPLHIGKTSIVTRDVADLDCCFSNFMQRLRVQRNVMPRFMWYVLNGNLGRNQLDYYSDTTTGLANLNRELIGNVTLAIPPLSEQFTIVRFLDNVHGNIRRLNRAKRKLIGLLEERKQALINQVVTGQMDARTGQSYPAYHTSGIELVGDVPEHWVCLPLKRIARIDNSGDYGAEPESGECILPVATTAQIDRDGHFSVGDMPLRSFTYKDAIRYRCHPGDILVVKSSGSIFNVITGKAGIVNANIPAFVFSNFLLRVVADSRVVDPRYLFLLLSGCLTIERVKLMVSGTTYPNLRVGEYASALLPIPPISEQNAILAFLARSVTGLTAAICSARREIDRLSEYRDRLFGDVVTGKLDVSSRESELGQVEVHAAQTELG